MLSSCMTSVKYKCHWRPACFKLYGPSYDMELCAIATRVLVCHRSKTQKLVFQSFHATKIVYINMIYIACVGQY
jgi:hypothetical protein